MSRAFTKPVSVVLFDNMQQQDAHEFLNYLLNTIGDLLAGSYHGSAVHAPSLTPMMVQLVSERWVSQDPGRGYRTYSREH